MASVFPIISSSKNSKIIIVSTPNGMNNEFYRIWNKALLENADSKKITDATWHPTKIHWSDFPGRDQHWKQIQLSTLNHNMTRWNQQFQCKFLGSVVTLIEAKKIEQFKAQFINKENIKKPYEIQIHSEISELKINMYVPPIPGHAYIIGADPSTGDGGDYHAMTVWDITNMYNIELVADFHANNIQPKKFAYILAKTGFLYNCAYIAIENNGVSYATLENLIGDFEYENIVHLGGNPKTNIAIHSSPQLKLAACLLAKELIEDPLRKIRIYNGDLINQMERFQKHSKMGKQPTYGCYGSHDDLIMSMIWAFYCLKFEILENYYTIRKYAENKLGNTIPLIVISDENSNTPEIKEIIQNLDNTFTNISKFHDENLEQSIEEEQAELMHNFVNNNNNISYTETNNSIDQSNNDTDFFSFIT